MTTIPPSESSSSPTEGEPLTGAVAQGPGADPAVQGSGGGLPVKLLKGCGCLVAVVALAVGVALLGNGDPASWGSALFGVVILIIIVGSSGLIGWWNR